MASKVTLQELSFTAASKVGQYFAVKISGDDTVVPAGANTDDAIGITDATQATYGREVPVVVAGVQKAIAAASLGAGALVAVANASGALGPIAAAGIASGAPAPVAAAYSIGKALTGATAAGQVFTVLLNPREVI